MKNPPDARLWVGYKIRAGDAVRKGFLTAQAITRGEASVTVDVKDGVFRY
jgi:hypothetical protein